jgi:hypothetical protein
MEGIVRAVTDHPLVAMAVCFAVLLILYFLFTSLIKLALILIIVAVAIGGYFYFRYPECRPTDFKDAVQKVRTGVCKAVDRGTEAYEKGKEMLDKGKEAYKMGNEWVDKGKTALDKGIDAIGKGKDAAGNLWKRLGADNEVGSHP